MLSGLWYVAFLCCAHEKVDEEAGRPTNWQARQDCLDARTLTSASHAFWRLDQGREGSEASAASVASVLAGT